MHNPSQSVATPNISPAAAWLLAVAVVAGTILAGLIAAQVVTDVQVYVGASGFLAAITSVAGVGFIVHLAVERVMCRLDQLEATIARQGGSIDEESAAAARRLNLRLLSTPN